LEFSAAIGVSLPKTPSTNPERLITAVHDAALAIQKALARERPIRARVPPHSQALTNKR